MDSKFRPGGAFTTSLRIGDTGLGVRTNRRSVNELLERVLPSYLADQNTADPNFSLLFGEDHDGARAVHFLSRAGVGVLRTTSIGRMVRALLLHLSDYVTPARTDVASIRAHVLVKGDRAVLVHNGVVTNLYTIERRLDRLGWTLLDVPSADIDIETGDLLLSPSRLDVDRSGWSELMQGYPIADRELHIHEQRRLPVAGWLIPRDQILETLPDTPAGLALSLSRQVAPTQHLPTRDALRAVHRLTQRAELHVMERRHDPAATEAILSGI